MALLWRPFIKELLVKSTKGYMLIDLTRSSFINGLHSNATTIQVAQYIVALNPEKSIRVL